MVNKIPNKIINKMGMGKDKAKGNRVKGKDRVKVKAKVVRGKDRVKAKVVSRAISNPPRFNGLTQISFTMNPW